MYSLPLICISVQDEMLLPLEGGEGPLGLIICPSRELASQTVEVITQYTDALKMVRGAHARHSHAMGQMLPVWKACKVLERSVHGVFAGVASSIAAAHPPSP